METVQRTVVRVETRTRTGPDAPADDGNFESSAVGDPGRLYGGKQSRETLPGPGRRSVMLPMVTR
jgi:hypothetical protein